MSHVIDPKMLCWKDIDKREETLVRGGGSAYGMRGRRDGETLVKINVWGPGDSLAIPTTVTSISDLHVGGTIFQRVNWSIGPS